jgi:hypothetical protein
MRRELPPCYNAPLDRREESAGRPAPYVRKEARDMGFRKLSVCLLVTAVVPWLLSSGCGGGGAGGREITVAGPVTITRTFKPGEVFKYKFKVDTQSGVKRTAYEQSISAQVELRTTSTVADVTADEVDMDMRFDYAVGAVTVSDEMQPDESISSLRGKELHFKLDPDGKVISWGGLSGEAALEQGAGQIAMLLYEIFPTLPEGPITVGTSWTEPYDVPEISSSVDRTFVGDTTYTVVGFREKYEIQCAEIKTATSFEFEGRAEQAGEVWLMSGSGTADGTILLSIKDGNIVYSDGQATMSLTGEGASVASAAATGTVEMGIKTHLVIELL